MLAQHTEEMYEEFPQEYDGDLNELDGNMQEES